MRSQEARAKTSKQIWNHQRVNHFDILLIDSENSVLSQYLQATMSKLSILTVQGFDQIIDRLKHSHCPSVIMVSLQYSTSEPFKLLAQIKRNLQTGDIPVIMVSDTSKDSERIRAYAQGCDDFICFPVSAKELKARIESKLRSMEKQQYITQLAYHDELTGVMNRRAYNQALAAEWARCRRARCEFSMLLIDIDHFKQFNDQYGHQKGDELLCFTSHVLKKTCARDSDIVARFGGDEFVILLADNNYDQCTYIAQRIIDNFKQSLNTSISIIPSPLASLSIGISSLTPNNKITPMDLFNQADEALYHAKSIGKGCWQAYKKGLV